jgi:hypothetical protein
VLRLSSSPAPAPAVERIVREDVGRKPRDHADASDNGPERLSQTTGPVIATCAIPIKSQTTYIGTINTLMGRARA